MRDARVHFTSPFIVTRRTPRGRVMLSIENYGLPSVDENSIFQVNSQCSSQHQPFKIPPLADKILQRISMRYVADVL